MEVHFANSGKRVIYKGTEHKIINSGIAADNVPYVELDPPNDELQARMCAQIRRDGNLTVRIGGNPRLVLGEDEYPYLR
jgi:hypothetical protein